MFRDRNADSLPTLVMLGILFGTFVGLILLVIIGQSNLVMGLGCVLLLSVLGGFVGLARGIRSYATTVLVYKGAVRLSIEYGTLEVVRPEGATLRMTASNRVLAAITEWLKSPIAQAEAIVLSKKGVQHLHSLRIPGLGNLPMHGEFFESDFALDCRCGCRQKVSLVTSVRRCEAHPELMEGNFVWSCTSCYSAQDCSHFSRSTHKLFELFRMASK